MTNAKYPGGVSRRKRLGQVHNCDGILSQNDGMRGVNATHYCHLLVRKCVRPVTYTVCCMDVPAVFGNYPHKMQAR